MGPQTPCSHLPLPLLLPFPAKPFSPLQGEGGGEGLRPEPPSLNSRGWGSQALGRNGASKAEGCEGGGGKGGRQRWESREEKMGETELGKREREK